MMTPKMRAELDEDVTQAARHLFLSNRIGEICKEEGTPKQAEFLLYVLQEELRLREQNKRQRLIKRAGFPVYKTFEGYSYQNVKLPPAFSQEELETCRFVAEKTNLVLYGPVGIGKTHLATAAGIKACELGYKTKFYTVTQLVLKLSKWGSIFTDDQMAAAMIDRLVHHGHLLLFEGRSYRMEHALMRQTTAAS